jgi:hypothetical protein
MHMGYAGLASWFRNLAGADEQVNGHARVRGKREGPIRTTSEECTNAAARSWDVVMCCKCGSPEAGSKSR